MTWDTPSRVICARPGSSRSAIIRYADHPRGDAGGSIHPRGDAGGSICRPETCAAQGLTDAFVQAAAEPPAVRVVIADVPTTNWAIGAALISDR
jgi:hypothetical protein